MPDNHITKLLCNSALNWRLTLLGRSVFLLTLELLANTACWIAAGIAFGRRDETRGTLSLALLAWTIGLRHGLDADHISAIDNATRGLISMGQLPVTCGLFFSLGHSTIVIAVNVAIAISTSVYDKISGVGDVGGIIGAAVSGSFLFIIGLANSIILFRIIRNRRRRQREAADIGVDHDDKKENSIMMRILGPVTTFVNKSWKMYPVGVLFGLGFDTASSIALLAVSALAEKDAGGKGIPRGDVVILPFLFTAGMTLVDSVDSILMLYAYAGTPDRAFALFERRVSITVNSAEGVGDSNQNTTTPTLPDHSNPENPEPQTMKTATNAKNADIEAVPKLREAVVSEKDDNMQPVQRTLRVKQHTMSGLSIALTLISILVAFSISLITILGVIGDNCAPCQRAADASDGGGLAGSWWRGWAKANDESGFIGAAIVGGFVLVLTSWYGGRWFMERIKRQKERGLATEGVKIHPAR